MLWFLAFIIGLAVASLLFAPDSRDTRSQRYGSWAPVTFAVRRSLTPR